MCLENFIGELMNQFAWYTVVVTKTSFKVRKLRAAYVSGYKQSHCLLQPVLVTYCKIYRYGGSYFNSMLSANISDIVQP